MQSDAKKRGNISVLMDYAGRRKVLTYLSWALSGISALIALMPFVFIWFIIRDVINAGGDFSGATNIAFYGWMAVACAFASMLIYFGGLMCSHIAAFRVASNMRKKTMRHLAGLPIGA